MRANDYQGKRALIIGLGISGRAAAHFLIQQDAHVHGVDSNRALLEEHQELIALRQKGVITQYDQDIQAISHFDFIVVSPGIPQTHFLYAAARQAGIPILGEIELGCRTIQNRLIGITGTNGKTTVTLLVTHIFNHCGQKAKALGNVGTPLTQELLSAHETDIFVLELSSYQLETFAQPVLDVAVILNVTPDHLDRYATMTEYAHAKFAIESCLKRDKSLYIEGEAFKNYGYFLKKSMEKTYGYFPDCFIFTDKDSLFVNGKKELSLPENYRGRVSHELENIMAAYAICREFGIEPCSFKEAMQTFKKPAHRLEFVLERKGVSYVNDSKGTNIDAVIRAVDSIQGPIILIAGGLDKGTAYTPWLRAFQNKVKGIYTIGQAADKIYKQLSHHIPVKICESLDQAVKQAAELAQSGDYVLLSPGCSSLDMFKDYAHRGEEFQRIVRQL